MMIDTADVCHVGPKLLDHCPDSPARFGRVDQVGGAPHLLTPTQLTLEINVRDKVPVIGSRFPALVSHRKQSHFLAVRPHQFHQLEQVHLSAAEAVVILVAIKNSHVEGPCLGVERRAGEIHR
jgi:hypothetical protein